MTSLTSQDILLNCTTYQLQSIKYTYENESKLIWKKFQLNSNPNLIWYNVLEVILEIIGISQENGHTRLFF